MRWIPAVLVMVAMGCGASVPPLEPGRPAREIYVSVRTTSLAEGLEEDEVAAAAPNRLEVLMGSSRDSVAPVHEVEIAGGACDARTDEMDYVDAVLMIRCAHDEIVVVRAEEALIVRTRNGDRQWRDVARQALTRSARVVASSE